MAIHNPIIPRDSRIYNTLIKLFWVSSLFRQEFFISINTESRAMFLIVYLEKE